MTLLVVSLAGALGAVGRYVISGWAQEKTRMDFPIGTLIVNVVGSFGLGLTLGAGTIDSDLTVALIGFFGGFTTFSSWMVETMRLPATLAPANVFVSLGAGILFAVLGFVVTA